MPNYDVGLGKTYSGATGIKDAVTQLLIDFPGGSGDHVVRVWPDYNYTTNTASSLGINLTGVTPTAIKKIIFQSQESTNGDFTKGSVLSSTGYTINGQRFFTIGVPYVEFYNFRYVEGSGITLRTATFDFAAAGTNHIVQNCLADFQSTGAPADLNFLYTNQVGATGGIINNCIAVGNNTGVGTLASFCLTNEVAEFNNCLAYNTGAVGWYMQNTASVLNNCGSVHPTDNSGSTRWQLSSNCTGDNNYGNGNESVATQPGSNYLDTTISAIAFTNASSDNLFLKRSSVLINNGTDVTTNNPQSIQEVDWTGNHQSPFNYAVIKNTFLSPPEFDEVYDQWQSGMVLSDVMEIGRPPVVGVREDVFVSGSPIYGYDEIGPYYEPAVASNKKTYQDIVDLLAGKTLTYVFAYKNLITTSIGVFLLEEGGSPFKVEITPSSGELDVTIPTLVGTATLTGNVDVQMVCTIAVTVDLNKATNAEKVKVYTFQEGQFRQLTLSFTGTARSTIGTSGNNISTSNNITRLYTNSLWNRVLTDEELFNVMLDPYIVYRDKTDIKLFEQLDLLESVVRDILRTLTIKQAGIFFQSISGLESDYA